MLTRCGHVLIRVHDLHQAVADYRAAGFDVRYATREDKAMHAHVWFADGPIIELLTTPRTAPLFRFPLEIAFGRGSGTRMVRWAQQDEGFCDVAVLVDDIDAARASLRAADVPMARTVRWTRTRPDGVCARFSFAYPRNDRLPFLVTAYDPPQHPPRVEHANGAIALSTVVLGVGDSDRSAVERIVGEHPGFRLVPAERTGVQAIELAGLSAEPDVALLHGAVIRHASPSGRQS